ncbi:2-oxo-4-hydroxy-4-carboxy-5-ureidoimidazoline decarboxylase-like [Venturia canescens]|uniref:2-oxo-4-hydroxy-4-carboxy-5-ureidoimidazoline decarboxylase-like n=1 Tax=Venturia canescens TaxID=32260 RepID=UPI001C9C370E|nr:2-oxo-4-hydroxy-4-carboxy-5-ureidoimidazoline decarboxylase-like [Venturia canescens]
MRHSHNVPHLPFKLGLPCCRIVGIFDMSMNSSGIFSIGEVNALAVDQFDWIFGNIIEHCPEATRKISARRPFKRVEDLKIAFDNYLDELEETEKEQILLKHPDLAGKLCDEGKLTLESKNEQKSAGLDKMTKDEKQTLNNLNHLYKEKFRFPFVICARENRVPAILTGIEERLKNQPESELLTSIEEVKKICRIRISDLVWPDP